MAEVDLSNRKFFADILNRKYFDGVFNCEKHGPVNCSYYMDEHNRKVWEECPKCVEEREALQNAKELEAQLERQKQKWRECNIKEKFFDMTFDIKNFNNKRKLKKLRWLFISTGALLAAAVVALLILKGSVIGDISLSDNNFTYGESTLTPDANVFFGNVSSYVTTFFPFTM